MQATLSMTASPTMVGKIECRFIIFVSVNGFLKSPFASLNFTEDYETQSVSVTYELENLPGGDYDKIDFQCYVNGDGEVMVDDLAMSATRVDTLQRQG